MESGISFQELMHCNDAETRRWREFLEQDCDALDVQVDITVPKTFAVSLSMSSLWNCAASSACWDAAPMPYEQFPTG
jgi:hypothetical protein